MKKVECLKLLRYAVNFNLNGITLDMMEHLYESHGATIVLNDGLVMRLNINNK